MSQEITLCHSFEVDEPSQKDYTVKARKAGCTKFVLFRGKTSGSGLILTKGPRNKGKL